MRNALRESSETKKTGMKSGLCCAAANINNAPWVNLCIKNHKAPKPTLLGAESFVVT